MAHLKLTTIEAATIRGARNDASKKAIKKEAIAAIRARLGIPSSVKLILLVDTTDSPYLGILQKGTRYPLLADAAGRYAGVDVPVPVAPPAPAPVAPAPVAPAPAVADRFQVANAGGVFVKLERTSMASLLRTYGAAATPPAGMPAINVGQYVLDTTDGSVYFRKA